MKKYVLDTRFFINVRTHYPSIYVSFWEALNEAAENGSLCSVDEVKKEIEQYGGKQEHLLEWVKTHKHVFTKPQEDEQKHVARIFGLESFQILGKKQINSGAPWADPFIIAKAMQIDGTVVTEELPAKKDNKGKAQALMKIPDVCKEFGVPCVSIEQFMKDQGWQF